MYYDDHNPPHFHARYGSEQALFHLDPVLLAAGTLPRRIEQQVLEWASRRQRELHDNWDRAMRHQPLMWIDP